MLWAIFHAFYLISQFFKIKIHYALNFCHIIYKSCLFSAGQNKTQFHACPSITFFRVMGGGFAFTIRLMFLFSWRYDVQVRRGTSMPTTPASRSLTRRQDAAASSTHRPIHLRKRRSASLHAHQRHTTLLFSLPSTLLLLPPLSSLPYHHSRQKVWEKF